MLNVGQFEHALNELLAWLDKTDETVDDISTSFGDPKQIEIELAKLKVEHRFESLSSNQGTITKKNQLYIVYYIFIFRLSKMMWMHTGTVWTP